MGPGQGGSRSEMGLGGRKYSGEDIGPRPGRVPGLFRQKGVIFRSDSQLNFYQYQWQFCKSAVICVNSVDEFFCFFVIVTMNVINIVYVM